MLSFTRENETEADQKAVLFMDKTGYDPKGLLTGLSKIREADFQGVESIPEYFKTHPGTANRIAHLAGLLADYQPPADKPPAPKTYDYQLVKYRLIGLYGDPDKYLSKLEQELAKNPDSPAINYGVGLLYGRGTQVKKGIDHLNRALAREIFNPVILLELGRLHIRNQDYDNALTVLEGVTGDKIVGDAAIYFRSVAQIETGNLTAAKEALIQLLDRNKKNGFSRANYHLANIMSQEQNVPMSHYYLGVYYAEKRDYKNAFRHLGRAVETLEDSKVKEDARERLEKLEEKKPRGRS